MTEVTAARRAVIVRNPRARRAPSERALWRAADPLRAAGWRVELRTTSAPGEATVVASGAAEAGADVVIACGGDGTVHEVANGLAGTETALGVAPAGTSDVWAREAFVPRDTARALALLPHARRLRADLGVANGRHFLLMCSVGLDAEVVRRVETRDATKRRFGRAAYVAAGVSVGLRARPVTVDLTVDGAPLRREVLVAVAGNTRLYGGVTRLTGAALADDGLLDLCLFHGGGLVHRARLAARALRGGLDRRHGRGIDYLRASRVEMTAVRPLPVQTDGEFIGETPLTLGVAPGALAVLVAPRPNPLFRASARPA